MNAGVGKQISSATAPTRILDMLVRKVPCSQERRRTEMHTMLNGDYKPDMNYNQMEHFNSSG